MTDLGFSVLSYIFPGNRQGLEYAMERLTVDHFTDSVQRTFFRIVVAYAEKYNDVFPGEYLLNVLRRNKIEESKILIFTETYNLYCQRNVVESAFQYAVDGLIDDRNKFLVGQALTTAFEINEQGSDVEGEFQEGWKEAAEYALSKVSDVQSGSNTDDAPEGDMRSEGDRMLAAYDAREKAEVLPGMMFGLAALDAMTSGIQPGEFALVAAYTNEGKSQLTAQLGWNACVKQGKHTYFATSETVRDTTMRRIFARHSKEPQFGYPKGLNSKDIKEGKLTPDEKAVFHDVVKDFTTNSNYASLYVAQMPRNATLNYLERSAVRVNRQGPKLEFMAIDYLQLLKSLRQRASEREEFNELLRETKVFGTGFDGGRGLAIVSPWQMRQNEYKEAVKSGRYDLSSLSDTSEAEKTPDIIVSLLRPSPDSDTGWLQILKNRDGPTMGPSQVFLDYRSSYIGGEAVALDPHALDVGGSVFDPGSIFGG